MTTLDCGFSVKRLRRGLAFFVTLTPLLVASCLAGCSKSGGTTTLSVFAASSLTDVMAELGTRYGQLHGNVVLKPSYAGSQELDRLIKEGQRSADVLVTADGASMDTVRRYVRDRKVVAHNQMAIAVAPGNPLRITGVASLADPRVRVVIGAPNNPAGRYAQQVFTQAGVTVVPRATDLDVRSVLTSVRTGEADAGIVYTTDIRAAGASVSGVAIPPPQNVVASYPAAVVKRSGHGSASETFVNWLTTSEAQAIFAKYGFQPA